MHQTIQRYFLLDICPRFRLVLFLYIDLNFSVSVFIVRHIPRVILNLMITESTRINGKVGTQAAF